MEDNKENREQGTGGGEREAPAGARVPLGFLGAAAAVAKGLLPPPKPETLDEVFAEIRKAGPPFEWSKERFDGWLVRAEAAAKRDMVEAVTRAAADAVNFTIEKWQREKTVARNVTVSGSAAAMREALKSVAAWLLERFGNPADPDHDKAEGFYILTTGVLAAPARNCDRFATAGEAMDAFFEEEAPADGETLFAQVLNWLFATAEGGAE